MTWCPSSLATIVNPLGSMKASSAENCWPAGRLPAAGKRHRIWPALLTTMIRLLPSSAMSRPPGNGPGLVTTGDPLGEASAPGEASDAPPLGVAAPPAADPVAFVVAAPDPGAAGPPVAADPPQAASTTALTARIAIARRRTRRRRSLAGLPERRQESDGRGLGVSWSIMRLSVTGRRSPSPPGCGSGSMKVPQRPPVSGGRRPAVTGRRHQAVAVVASVTPASTSQRSASIAARQPSPAAVIAWR